MPVEELREKEDIKEEFRRVFLEDGLGDAEERFGILELFLDSESHLKPQEMVEMAIKRGIEITEERLESCMEGFANYGIAKKIKLDDGRILYEHLHLERHHDHMVCVKCGRLDEFSNNVIERHQSDAARSRGFLPLRHNLVIYGLCRDCRKERGQILPLAFANPGELVTIEEFRGGRRVQRRLHSMGLIRGKEIEVINAQSNGPTILAFDGSRLAIGQGLSMKIMVSVDTEED